LQMVLRQIVRYSICKCHPKNVEVELKNIFCVSVSRFAVSLAMVDSK
jgi:hypothetical protein